MLAEQAFLSLHQPDLARTDVEDAGVSHLRPPHRRTIVYTIGFQGVLGGIGRDAPATTSVGLVMLVHNPSCFVLAPSQLPRRTASWAFVRVVADRKAYSSEQSSAPHTRAPRWLHNLLSSTTEVENTFRTQQCFPMQGQSSGRATAHSQGQRSKLADFTGPFRSGTSPHCRQPTPRSAPFSAFAPELAARCSQSRRACHSSWHISGHLHQPAVR